MKRIFLIALILLISQNNFVFCEFEDIFGDENIQPTPSPIKTALGKKGSETAERLSFVPQDEWEDQEVCDLHEKCVPYYLCKVDGEINSDGSMLIDERFDGDGKDLPETCPSLQQCCKRVDTILERNITENLCENSQFKTPQSCGVHNSKGLAGKINSMQNNVLYAQFAEFPWMMAILEENTVGSSKVPTYKCAGSLIHPKVVMTAAHSIADLNSRKIVVRGGEWDTQSTNEMCEHVDRRVDRIIRHEEFTRENLRNNIALMILNQEFELSPFINTVCLPPQNLNFDNKRCFSGGWGKNKFGKAGIYQAFLKKVKIPVVPHDKCQVMLRKTRLGPDFILHDGFLCAGGEDSTDVCQGDGGSALVCEISNKPDHYYQAGIVAGGIGCGTKGVPGFYVNVPKYRDWIDTKFRSLNFHARSYTN